MSPTDFTNKNDEITSGLHPKRWNINTEFHAYIETFVHNFDDIIKTFLITALSDVFRCEYYLFYQLNPLTLVNIT